jgi:hypothetical protein
VARFGQVEVNDVIACIVRDETHKIGGFDWLNMGIALAESGLMSNAVGDAGCSIGLFQLNTCGGQGSAYADNPDALKDPRLNCRIGIPPIAVATWQATVRGYAGERFIREVARSSGHPGWVGLEDARLTHIVNSVKRLITNARGQIVAWPEFDPRVCAGGPLPPPPLGSWTEGPAPRDATEADGAIHRHLERMGELVDRF